MIGEFEITRFNSLPSIESADAGIKAGNCFEDALSNIGNVFCEHAMHAEWGISLLHKHWPVENREFPLQEIRRSQVPRELITRPVQKQRFENAWPSVLALEEDLLRPIEFSSDPIVSDANRLLARKRGFVSELRLLLKKNGFSGIFGLISGRRSNPGFELVEVTYEGRVSILKEMRPEEFDMQKVIQTSWFFAPDFTGTKCKGNQCMSYCSVGTGGGHTHGHSPPYHDPNG